MRQNGRSQVRKGRRQVSRWQSLEARLWSRVDIRGPDECWPSVGRGKCPDGRGRLAAYGRRMVAPRVAWMLFHSVSRLPRWGRILHECDRPQCTNPRHLWLGTLGDNLSDSYRKGRRPPSPSGKDHYNSKKTHCKRGHSFSEHGRIMRGGGRTCRLCMELHRANWEQRKGRAHA